MRKWGSTLWPGLLAAAALLATACDRPASLVDSHVDKPLPEKLAVFGEVGLAGEVRPAPRGQERLKEAAKLGFTQAINPRANQPKQKIDGLEIIAVERVADAIARFRV